MTVFRVGKTRWKDDLTGEGSRKFGGRWNHIGVACIYTSESRALSLLEYSSHISLDLIPRALSFTVFKIPDDRIYVCKESLLPGNWKNVSYSVECQDFGTKILRHHLVIRLPSVVLPYEMNYILNCNHEDFARLVRIQITEDYSYDLRIKQL